MRKIKLLMVVCVPMLCLHSYGQTKEPTPVNIPVKTCCKADSDKAANIVANPISVKPDSTKNQNVYVTVKNEGESKSWWSDWLPFFATIVVAYGAYRGVIKQSKASSISGFRVNWIEDLRVSYSQFLIALRNVDNKIRMGTLDPTVYSGDKDLDEVNFLKTKIKLSLNHNGVTDPEHVEFWTALLQYMEDHRAYYKGPFSETIENDLDVKRVKMETLLLTIFKKEWEKAKNLG